MSTLNTVKVQLQKLIDSANAVTGNADADLTTAVNALIAVASSGGGGSSGGDSDLVKYVTFMTEDGMTELFKMPVLAGDDCKDPITHGDIETPLKDSDNTSHYTYSGWSFTSGGEADESALANVTEDKTVYAAFTASVRYYTVNFYDGETLVDTVQVTYGATATTAYTKYGWELVVWNPSNENITQDTDCYGTWEEGLTFANASWEKIAEISNTLESGGTQDYFRVGDTKIIEYGGNTLTLEIGGFLHDDLADGSGKAGISLLAKSVVTSDVNFNLGTDSTTFSDSVVANLPVELASIIKTVTKEVDSTGNSGVITDVATEDYAAWIPSLKELNLTTTIQSSYYTELGTSYDVYTNYTDWRKCEEGGSEYREYFTRSLRRVTGNPSFFGKDNESMTETKFGASALAGAYFVFGICV